MAHDATPRAEDESARQYFLRVSPQHTLFSRYLEGVLRNLLLRSGVDFDSVSARAKSAESALEKMRRKAYESPLMVQDMTGVRIIVRHASDIRRVRDLVFGEFLVENEEGRGAASAEVFGYSGYHMVVKLSPERASLLENEAFENLQAEIQVRSILQHAWASISHSLDYKHESAAPVEIRRSLHRVAALLESGDLLLDQYRDEMLRLRDSNEAPPNEAPALAVDYLLDCDGIDWTQLGRQAIGAGWRSADTAIGTAQEGIRDRDAMERLVDAARILGFERYEDLLSVLPRISDQLLKRLAEGGKERRYTPYAVAPDVLGLCICALNVEVAADPALRLPLTSIYRPELFDAAIAAGRAESGA